jgi:hypothetical protein
MTKLYEGVVDVTDIRFAVDPLEVEQIVNSIEQLLPGASNEFLDICRNTRPFVSLHELNKVGQTRKDLRNLLGYLIKAKETYEDLNPAGQMSLQADFGLVLETLLANVDSANSYAKGLRDGKPSLHYRNFLAVDVARLIRKYGKQPQAVSFIQGKKNQPTDQTYHEIFKHAVRLVDGIITDRLFEYLQYGAANS